MKKLINEEIKLTQDNDDLAISMLSQKPVNIVKIITKRTGLEEWTKRIFYQVYSDISYEDLVVRFIREKYSLNEELAILRKSHYEPLDEFIEYNNFAEDCKVKAKAFIEERNKALGE